MSYAEAVGRRRRQIGLSTKIINWNYKCLFNTNYTPKQFDNHANMHHKQRELILHRAMFNGCHAETTCAQIFGVPNAERRLRLRFVMQHHLFRTPRKSVIKQQQTKTGDSEERRMQTCSNRPQHRQIPAPANKHPVRALLRVPAAAARDPSKILAIADTVGKTG